MWWTSIYFFLKKKKQIRCQGVGWFFGTQKKWAHMGPLGEKILDFPRATSDLWPTSPSWTCHEGLPLSFLGGGVHFPTTQVGKTMSHTYKKTKIIEKQKSSKKKKSEKNLVENDESSWPRLWTVTNQGNGLVLRNHELFRGRATLTPPVGGETCLKSAHFSTNGAKNGHEDGPQNRFWAHFT